MTLTKASLRVSGLGAWGRLVVIRLPWGLFFLLFSTSWLVFSRRSPFLGELWSCWSFASNKAWGWSSRRSSVLFVFPFSSRACPTVIVRHDIVLTLLRFLISVSWIQSSRLGWTRSDGTFCDVSSSLHIPSSSVFVLFSDGCGSLFAMLFCCSLSFCFFFFFLLSLLFAACFFFLFSSRTLSSSSS